MAANEELLKFVREALGRKASKTEIERALAEAGWGREDARRALDAFADVDFPVPVPKPRAYISAREAFLYLVIFATLGIVAVNFGALVFLLIDRFVPDAAFDPQTRYGDGQLRRAISALLVATPIYLALSVKMARELRLDPTRASSKIRKWLTYLTLFIAASVLIADAITVLYNLLGGELTMRFALKALTVAATAGAIFGYYLWDLREGKRSP